MIKLDQGAAEPVAKRNTLAFAQIIELHPCIPTGYVLQALDHLPCRVRKLKAGCGRALVPDYLSLMNVSSSSDGVSQPRQSQGSFCHTVDP